MVNSSIPQPQPRFVYGLETKIKGNVNFITDEDVVYPVAGVLVFHNFVQRRQKFIKLPDKGLNVMSILVSPNKKLIAITERGERPTVTLYDTQTLKKKKQLAIPADKEVTTEVFTAIAFTWDSRYLVAVSGEPDWNMYVFRCDKGKLETSTKANNSNGTGTVNQIACNPNDINVVILVGEALFRILACTDKVWRQYGFSKADMLNVKCAVWLSQDRLLAGCADGKLLVIESAELKMVFWAGDLPVVNMKAKEGLEHQTSQTNISIPSVGSIHSGEDYEIRSLIAFPRGFLFAYNNGLVHLYEMETHHRYWKRNIFRVPDISVVRENDKSIEVMNEVNTICINPSQDRLLVTCRQKQIYGVRLWLQDITVAPEIPFTEVGPSLHHGKISGIAICTWKPIFLTSGEYDRTLRIWNYMNYNLELVKQYQEDVSTVALHPSGLYALVGFSDKLRYLTILIDDFLTTREFPIRSCKECCFSKSGHMFAAAHGNVIQVFNSTTFENILVLKGHSGRIKDMTWPHNDLKMASCGTEGAVYEWDMTNAKRIGETIIKSCSFSGSAITSEGNSIYAIGSDGHVRFIINSNVIREVSVISSGLDCVALSNIDTMLFVSGNEGTIYSLRLPLIDVAEFNEANVHNKPIKKMRITFDDKMLISVSQAGMIIIWKLLNTEGKTVKMEKDFSDLATNILISREDLEEKIIFIRDLQQRMHELETEHAYQARQSEVTNKLKIKELHEGYCAAIEELKEKNEQLESDHAQEISNINMEINKMKSSHDDFIQQIETSYNEKLIIEYDKYLRLEEKMERMRMRYEVELETLRKAKEDSERDITNNFLEQLKEKEVQLEEMVEQQQQKAKEHELIKQQIEDDADREIYELKAYHERDLKEEQDNNVRLKGETNIIRKKLMTSQKEIDDLKHNVYSLENEHAKLKVVIVSFEKDIADLKKEIIERDATIQDKERRIYELKHKNQELEKFKYILDFKIKELKSYIEPRETTIREQSEQINDMVNELENLQRVVMNLDLQLSELREKLFAADNEIKSEVLKNRALKAELKMIRNDIHDASGYIQNVPRLTKAIKAMYHKYNADKDFELTKAEDLESKNEFLRQRDFLERTVKTLQLQVTKKTATGGSDKVRLIDENSALIVETNYLRKELKEELLSNKKMQSFLGLSGKCVLPQVGQKRLNDAIATREEIHQEYKGRINVVETQTRALREENARLLAKISEEADEDEKTSDTSEAVAK